MDLVELLTKCDFLSSLFGLSLKDKLNKEDSKMKLLKKYINFSSILMLAFVGVFVLTFVPDSDERTLLLLGDASTIVGGKHRALLSPVEFSYILIPFLFITFYHYENYNWLRRANDKIAELRLVRLSRARYVKTIKNVRFCIVLGPLALSFVSTILLFSSYYSFPDRLKSFPLEMTLPGTIYSAFLHYLANTIILHFISQIYIMVLFTKDLYRKLNFWVKIELRKRSLPIERIFEEYFEEFSMICLMFNNLRKHIKRYFTIMAFALAPSCILLLYIPIHRQEQTIIVRVLTAGAWFVHVGGIFFFAVFLGTITKAASELETLFYEYFHFRNGSSVLTISDSTRTKFERYFHIIWDHEVGVKLGGKGITPDSLIMLFFQNLGYIALAVSNLAKINKYLLRRIVL